MSRLASLVLAVTLLAQAASSQGPVRAPQPGPGEIRGSLVDSMSHRPVGAGSITVRRARDTAFAGGALVREDGTFKVDGLEPGAYQVRVRSIGFAQLVRPATVTVEKPTVDLGAIALSTVAAKLETQNVTAERDEAVVQPDRIVFSTKNMPAATGGTAIDVLRTVPQVEVDANNHVSLRGNSNVVVQINGRATPLKGDQLGAMLAQLPANTLKTIEVAANPSAKDDPEGTAGIINLVLNQEAELGLSGGIFANTSSTGLASLGGNVGEQRGKFTFYIAPNIYLDHRAMTGRIARENLVLSTPHFVDTDLSGGQRPMSGGGNLRTEYRFTPLNTLTLDSYFGGGHFTNDITSSYVNFSAARAQTGAFTQSTATASDNFYQDWDLAFRRQGKPTEPQLTIEAEYSNNWNQDRKSTRLNSSHLVISYAVFC